MSIVAAWLWMGGCAAPGSDKGGGDNGAEDTGEPVVDCADPGAVATGARGIATAMTVSFSTDTAATADVEWGYGTDYGYTTRAETADRTDHRILVPGMAAGETVHWRARIHGTDGLCLGPDQVYDVPAMTSPRSNLDLTTSTAGFTSGFRLFPTTGDPPLAVIVDDAGRIVWYAAPDTGLSPVQVALDRDGLHADVLLEDTDHEQDIGGIWKVALDLSDSTFYPLHFIHHAFVQLDDGGFVFLQTDPRTVQRQDVAGDALVRVDANGENPETIWSTWDEWTPDMAAIQAEDSHYYPNYLDWTHGNSVNLREDGSVLVSFHGVSAVIHLDLDGTRRWTMGGQDAGVPSDFTFQGADDELFVRQHNPVEVDGGLLVFDNGTGLQGTFSEAGEYAVDEDALTFRRTWSYALSPPIYVSREGDVQRLANGDTLIDWGAGAALTEVTPEGDIVWEITEGNEANGSTFGFMELATQIGGGLP